MHHVLQQNKFCQYIHSSTGSHNNTTTKKAGKGRSFIIRNYTHAGQQVHHNHRSIILFELWQQKLKNLSAPGKLTAQYRYLPLPDYREFKYGHNKYSPRITNCDNTIRHTWSINRANISLKLQVPHSLGTFLDNVCLPSNVKNCESSTQCFSWLTQSYG